MHFDPDRLALVADRVLGTRRLRFNEKGRYIIRSLALMPQAFERSLFIPLKS